MANGAFCSACRRWCRSLTTPLCAGGEDRLLAKLGAPPPQCCDVCPQAKTDAERKQQLAQQEQQVSARCPLRPRARTSRRLSLPSFSYLCRSAMVKHTRFLIPMFFGLLLVSDIASPRGKLAKMRALTAPRARSASWSSRSARKPSAKSSRCARCARSLFCLSAQPNLCGGACSLWHLADLRASLSSLCARSDGSSNSNRSWRKNAGARRPKRRSRCLDWLTAPSTRTLRLGARLRWCPRPLLSSPCCANAFSARPLIAMPAPPRSDDRMPISARCGWKNSAGSRWPSRRDRSAPAVLGVSPSARCSRSYAHAFKCLLAVLFAAPTIGLFSLTTACLQRQLAEQQKRQLQEAERHREQLVRHVDVRASNARETAPLSRPCCFPVHVLGAITADLQLSLCDQHR